MTSMTEGAQLVGAGFPLLPRVNLLPPEIAASRRFRQVQYALGAALLAAVALVVLLYVLAAHSVSAARSDLAVADTRNATLTRQVAQYQNVTAIRAQAAAAHAMLVTAMGPEVRFSHVLSDLSLTIPDNVWLTSLNYSETGPSATSDPNAIGTMSVSAVGFAHDDVAVWLDAVAAQPNYINPDFASSTEGLIGTRKTVTFGSSAQLSQAALSHRYTVAAGG